MRQVCKNVYLFHELSPEAQQKAVDHEASLQRDEWDDEAVHDDFIAISRFLGLDRVEVSYSGFSSQGDGASFTGHFDPKKLNLEGLKKYAPVDEKLHKIGEDLSKLTQDVHIERMSGGYVHSNTMYSDDGDITPFRKLADWLYATMEADYDYIGSEENAREFLWHGNLEFYEDGSRFHG